MLRHYGPSWRRAAPVDPRPARRALARRPRSASLLCQIGQADQLHTDDVQQLRDSLGDLGGLTADVWALFALVLSVTDETSGRP
jgi:hypothetical protein